MVRTNRLLALGVVLLATCPLGAHALGDDSGTRALGGVPVCNGEDELQLPLDIDRWVHLFAGRIVAQPGRPIRDSGNRPCSTHAITGMIASKRSTFRPPRQWNMPGTMNRRKSSRTAGPLSARTRS